MADHMANDCHTTRSREQRCGDECRGQSGKDKEGDGGDGSVKPAENDALSLEPPQDKFLPESDMGEEEDSAAAL